MAREYGFPRERAYLGILCSISRVPCGQHHEPSGNREKIWHDSKSRACKRNARARSAKVPTLSWVACCQGVRKGVRCGWGEEGVGLMFRGAKVGRKIS